MNLKASLFLYYQACFRSISNVESQLNVIHPMKTSGFYFENNTYWLYCEGLIILLNQSLTNLVIQDLILSFYQTPIIAEAFILKINYKANFFFTTCDSPYELLIFYFQKPTRSLLRARFWSVRRAKIFVAIRPKILKVRIKRSHLFRAAFCPKLRFSHSCLR